MPTPRVYLGYYVIFPTMIPHLRCLYGYDFSYHNFAPTVLKVNKVPLRR